MTIDDITVSVCIPTYNRPGMLLHCLQSVFEQTVLPQEIVIGDDSTDDRTEKLLTALRVPGQISLNYKRNPPVSSKARNLTKARNISSIFARAHSSWLYLIHDDDWLLPKAIEYAMSPIRAGEPVDVIYGSHLVANASGSIDFALSASANQIFARTGERWGAQPNALWSAIRQQMPTSFLVRAGLVRDIGYLCDWAEKASSYDGEFEFGVKAAINGARFFLLSETVYVYRLSRESIGRGEHADADSCAIDAAYMIWLNRGLASSVADKELRKHIRGIIYRAVVSCGLRKNRRLEALTWALHPRLGVRWLGREGVGVISVLCFPGLREWLKRTVRQRHEAA
jgi:glycosyltransferase involved in cell wall biosynthesis